MATTKRVIPIAQAKTVSPEDALLRDGWKRQTTIGEPRLSEIVKNYQTMGFEVHVEEYKVEGMVATPVSTPARKWGMSYGTVYVRKSADAAPDDELFED
ncbi:MAG: hypothetical protein IPM03_00015 [Sulfuritalea sp.]|nr:hypothetical protein [Sulfuritalea sp.]